MDELNFPQDFTEISSLSSGDFTPVVTVSDGEMKKIQTINLKGDTGATPVSVEFVGDDMVFTKDDSTEITLDNAKVDLKGDTGTAGAVIYSTLLIPDNSIGVDGDRAFSTYSTAEVFYKSGGTRALVNALKGTTGDDGASIVSGAFVGDDLVFTKDDASTVTITDAKIDLQGEKGDKGDKTIIWSTILIPDNAVGTDGDWAFSTSSTGNVYYKSAGNWALVNSYRGPAGTDGADGKSPVSASFVGDDMVFVLDDASTVTLAGAKTTLTGPAGADGTDGDSFEWLGAYNGGTAYLPGQAVSYLSQSYMCKLASTGNLPTNTTYFDLMAAKGADGTGTGDMMASVYDPNTLEKPLQPSLTCVSKIANYTAQPFELVNCDISAGGFTVTLPSAPADETVIYVKLNGIGTNNELTIATSGTDKFNTATGNTEIYIYLFGGYAQCQYCAATGIWTTFISAGTLNFATNFPGVDAATPITNSNISIDTTTRVLTITPPLGHFNVFTDGGGIIKTHRKGTVSFPAWTDTSGVWYFYFDNTGTAITTQTPRSADMFASIAPIYRIVWNATLSGAAKLVAKYVEYHQNTISADDHTWKHLSGAIRANGFDIKSNALTTGTPNADGRNTTIALTTGTNIDDNLAYTVTNDSTPTGDWEQDMGNITPASLNATNSGQFKTFVYSGGLMSFLPATRFPFAWDVATNRPEYITSGGVRTLVASGDYFVYFVYGTQNPGVGEAIKIVSAPVAYGNITNARAVTWTDIQNTYPIFADGEIRPLYKLIFLANTAWDDATKNARLYETQDIRKAAVTSTATATGSLPASSVTVIPAGNIASTNVQSALEELDSEKLASISFTDANISTSDVTTNNASTTAHGFSPKVTAPASGNLNILGVANGETVRADKLLLDSTSPSTQAFGDSAASGTSLKAARIDHKHAMPASTKDTTAVTGILKGNGTIVSAAAASDITGQLITGFSSGAGTVAGTDTILQAINKLDGNTIGKVDKSTYDANTILKADTDNTPSALTVAEQTLVGRKTGGNITALTTTEVRTILNVADGATANAKANSTEVTTGTDDTKFITADAFSGSNYGKRIVQMVLTDDATALTTGDGKGKVFIVPAEMNGRNLVSAHAAVTTVSSSGTPTYQVRNITDSVDMLSTRITIDASEFTSYTAATAPVIDTANDDVATGDRITVDKDVAGTGEKGDVIILSFQTP